MKETKITIQITPNQKTIGPDEILQMIFYRNRTSKNKSKDEKNYSIDAKKILQLCARKEHLKDSDYIQMSGELNLSVSEYQFILKKLRKAGMIYKNEGFYRIDSKFFKHIKSIYVGWRNYLEDLDALD